MPKYSNKKRIITESPDSEDVSVAIKKRNLHSDGEREVINPIPSSIVRTPSLVSTIGTVAALLSGAAVASAMRLKNSSPTSVQDERIFQTHYTRSNGNVTESFEVSQKPKTSKSTNTNSFF